MNNRGLLNNKIQTCNNEILLDKDTLLNPPRWHDLINSQSGLFRIKALHEVSEKICDKFYNGDKSPYYGEMPEIHPVDWQTQSLHRYAGKALGYDLPCLISADRPAKGRIMLCAQDPFRKEISVNVTVGTFFGLDSEYHRTRRHWKMIWNFIKSCVAVSYDIWVTDAIKIFAGPGVVNRDGELRDLCVSVIKKEIEMFEPDKILAFGRNAKYYLESIGDRVRHVPHPVARGQNGPLSERAKTYSQALFGSDTPC